MRNYLTYIILGVVFIASCNTEAPIDNNSEAVFFIRGEINGANVNLSAGDDNYYMLPSYFDDTLDIRQFSGKLGPYNCVGDVDCPQSIQISIREVEKNNGNREGIEKTVFPRICDVRGPASYLFQSYKASFTSKSFPNGMAHTWYFGDGSSSSDINPVHYYLNPLDSVVSPVLVVDNSVNSCQNSISYVVNFEAPCTVDFFPTYIFSQITLNPYPTIGRSELWSYNGDSYEPFGSKGPPTDSITTVCLQSTETATNCLASKCKNVVLDTTSVGCVANFDVVKEKVTLKDVKDYSQVTIKWQNELGKIYQSDLFAQPNSFEFEIIEVDDYKNTPDGSSTKKVTIKFEVRLFGDSETDYVDFTSEKSVIALAYPKI